MHIFSERNLWLIEVRYIKIRSFSMQTKAKWILCFGYIVSFTHHSYLYLGKNFWLETTNWLQPSKIQCEINWTSLHEKWEERRLFSEAWRSKQLFHTLLQNLGFWKIHTLREKNHSDPSEGNPAFSIIFLAKTQNRLQELRKQISYFFFFPHTSQDLGKKSPLKGSFTLGKTLQNLTRWLV